MMRDMIYRQDALHFTLKVPGRGVCKRERDAIMKAIQEYALYIAALPSAQPETCEGCKHAGKWKDEVEYGYPSPCTSCKRRATDNYER